MAEILDPLPDRRAPEAERAPAPPMLPRIWATLLWPIWYLAAFIGGSIAIGLTAVIVYETVRVVLPWADSAAEVWRRAGVI